MAHRDTPLAVMLALTAIVPFISVWQPPWWPSAAAVAAGIGAAAVEMVGRRRTGRPPTGGAGLATHAAAAGVLAIVAVGRLNPVVALAALRDAPAQILSAPIPAPASPAVCATAVVMVWLTVLITIRLALRTNAWAPIAAPATCILTAVLLARGNADTVWPGMAFAALAAGWVTWRRFQDRHHDAIGAGAGRVLLIAAVAAGTTLLGATAFGTGRPHPGPYLAAPDVPTRVGLRDPLATVTAAQRISPGAPADAELFRWEGPAPATTDAAGMWRFVVLDRFDGGVWRESGSYRSSGSSAVTPGDPEPSHIRTATTARTTRVEMRSSPFPWLPTAAATRQLDADGATLGRAESGAVARLDGPADATRLVVRSADPDLPDRRVPAARWSGTSSPLGYDMSDRPAALTELTATALGDDDRTRLDRLADLFRNGGIRHDPTAPAGTSFASVTALVAHRTSPTATATDAQFATAFALVADASGYRTRLVIGTGAGDPTGDARIVHTHELQVWPEVAFGTPERPIWVPFAPTPRGAAAGRPTADAEPAADAPTDATRDATRDATTRRGEAVSPQGGGGSSRNTGRHDATAARNRAAQTSAAPGGTVIVIVVVVGLGAIGIVARIATVARRRRRRRTQPSAAAQLAGAWATLAEAIGCFTPTPPGATVGGLATSAAMIAPSAAADLAVCRRAVDRLAFAHHTAAAPTGDEIAAAWRAADAVVTAADAAAPPARRLCWRLGRWRTPKSS